MSVSRSILDEETWACSAFTLRVGFRRKVRVFAARWLLEARGGAHRVLVIASRTVYTLGAGCCFVEFGGPPRVDLFALGDEVKIALASSRY